ncbi:MAG: hypothetical protein AAFR37_06780 [Cyanobacteria bacterium J06628_3]
MSSVLEITEILYLDQLLLGDIEESLATLNLLKSPPRSATLSGMKQLLAKFSVSGIREGGADDVSARIYLQR